MSFEWLVAVRYLRSPNKPPVLRLVTLFSVVGVSAGVFTLVVALAMNSGFRQALQDRLLGVTAHVNLTREAGDGIRDYRTLGETLRAVPGVISASPAIYQTVLLSAGGRARGIVLKGVDPELERKSNEILEREASSSGGARDFSADEHGIEALLLGYTLAQELKIAAGDYVTITSPEGRLTPFGMTPRTRRFRVTGIFNSGFFDYDANWGFVTLASAQGLRGISDLVNVLEFRVASIEKAGEVAQEILRRAGNGFSVTTWMEQNRALFRALRLEKVVTATFIGLITFVAALNILVVLAMTVTEKARDIAVLMAMGARRNQVRNIFLWQGLTVAGGGTIIGLVAGFSFAWIADHYRLLALDPEIYSVPYVPFRANLLDAVWIIAATLLISLLATLVPARAASRLLPVEILRYE
jgi:lipoprotein-releasing system permease protein